MTEISLPNYWEHLGELMKSISGIYVSILAVFASTPALAGVQFPISFSKSVCPDEFENQLSALNALNKLITDDLASCTAGAFKDSGSILSVDSIAIRRQFSHMCNTGQAILFAQVSGKCVIP
jgi:hypothetical protein